MPTEKIDERYSLDAWKGTMGDIADLFDGARALVEQASAEGEEVAGSVSAEMPNRDLTFDSIAEFREWSKAGKLSQAEGMRSGAHVRPFEKLNASVTVRRGRYASGLTVNVSGTNPVDVSGIAEQLRKRVDGGRRNRPKMGTLRTAVAVPCLALIVGANLLIDVSVPAALVVAALWLASAAALIFTEDIAFWLVPVVEVLPDRESPTTFERWRGKMLAGAGAVFLVLLGVVGQAVLSK